MVGASNHKVMVVSQCGLVDGHVLVVVLSSKSGTGLFSAIQIQCIFPKIPNKNRHNSAIFSHNDPQRSTIQSEMREQTIPNKAWTEWPASPLPELCSWGKTSWGILHGAAKNVANTWKNVAGLAPQGIVDAAVLFELGGLIQHLAQPSGPVAQCSPMSSIHCHWEKHKKMMSQMAHGMLGGYVTAYVIYVLDPDDPAIFGNDCRTSSIWSSNDSASSWRSFR